MYSTNARSPKAVFSRNVQEQEFQLLFHSFIDKISSHVAVK